MYVFILKRIPIVQLRKMQLIINPFCHNFIQKIPRLYTEQTPRKSKNLLFFSATQSKTKLLCQNSPLLPLVFPSLFVILRTKNKLPQGHVTAASRAELLKETQKTFSFCLSSVRNAKLGRYS